MKEKLFYENAADYEKLYYSDGKHISECEALDAIFHNNTDIVINKILDIGCGTGLHARELLTKGYQVTGLDISPVMLSIAAPRVTQLGGRLIHADITEWTEEPARYDAAIALFQVMSYLLKPDQTIAAFKNIFNCLAPGGILAFDVVSALWAYRHFEPIYVADVSDGVMVWKRELDESNDILKAESLYYLNGDKKSDSHIFKLFTGPELALLLMGIGYQDVECYSSWNLDLYTSAVPKLHVLAKKGG